MVANCQQSLPNPVNFPWTNTGYGKAWKDKLMSNKYELTFTTEGAGGGGGGGIVLKCA